jgi:group I intron endonuclease
MQTLVMRILIYAKRIYLDPASEKICISLENRNSSGVYALICKVTNKVYIGSSVKLGARLLDYMQPAYLFSRPNSPLIRALVKYGNINFCFIVLETCKPGEVLKREQYWIDLIRPEYNLSPTAGSTLGFSLSEETKAKLRTIRVGSTHSLETRQLMSETRKGPNNPWFGKSPSEETRAKMSGPWYTCSVPVDQAAKKGALNPNFGHNRSAEVINRIRVNHPHTKRVYQYDLDRITLISQYDSIRQAAEFTGVSRNYITRCLNKGELVHGKWFFSITPPA